MDKKQDADCEGNNLIGMTAEARGYGVWAKISGADIKGFMLVIIMLMCTAALWWQTTEMNRERREGDDASRAAFVAQHTVTQNLQKDIIKNQSEIIKLLSEGQAKTERASMVLTYVLTLDDAERKRLNLRMPDELRYAYTNDERRRQR